MTPLTSAYRYRLLSISGSSYCYAPVPGADETLALMDVIDASVLDCPYYGSPQMTRHLKRISRYVRRPQAPQLMARSSAAKLSRKPGPHSLKTGDGDLS